MRSTPAIVVLASAMLAGAALVACGAPAPAAPPASRAIAPDGGAEAAAPEQGADGTPSLDALAARGPTDAPLMREALRLEHASPRSPDIRAERDLCLRAVFAAPRPARAWFADESGAARGEITSSATGTGTAPPRGPACAKKGEALHLVVETSEPPARAVIFAAP